MAMPTPPPKPPSRPGNSQQQVIPHEAAQQRSRPREIHPAVTEFHNKYAEVWIENDELRAENGKLQRENDVLRKLDAEKSALIDSLRAGIAEAQRATDQRLGTQEVHYRERLAEADRAKERYLRYAVSIAADIKSSIAALEAADATAMEMAQAPSDKTLDAVDEAIAAARRDNV